MEIHPLKVYELTGFTESLYDSLDKGSDFSATRAPSMNHSAVSQMSGEIYSLCRRIVQQQSANNNLHMILQQDSVALNPPYGKI